MYVPMCKIGSQWEFAVMMQVAHTQCSVSLERWDGWEVGGRLKREGTYVICLIMADSC